MLVYNLHALFWNEDEGDTEFGHEATFDSAEAAMAWVPARLAKGDYRWRLYRCSGVGRRLRRWIALVPREKRYRPGGFSAFVVDEDVVLSHAVPAPMLPPQVP